MGKQVTASKELLREASIIEIGPLGRAFDVGPNAIRAAARRAGIEVTRLPNGRTRALTIAQAELVIREMCG